MDESRYKVKKKKKFKKVFLIKFWTFIIIILLSLILFFLNKFQIINLESFIKNIPTKIVNLFTKDDTNSETQVTIKEDRDFVDLFRTRLPSQRLEFASSSEVSESGEQKIYLKNTYNDSGYILVNTKDDVNYVWITFASAIAGEPLKSKLEKNLKNLEYIDLRNGNKVFYKFNDFMPASQPSTVLPTDTIRPSIPTTTSIEVNNQNDINTHTASTTN